jgi:hypothetical protein
VALLLWRLWLAGEARAPSTAGLSAAIALARERERTVLAPLRAMRAAAEGGLRGAVLAAELQAERQLIEALETLETHPAAAHRDPAATLGELTAAWGDPPPEGLLANLAATVFPPSRV